MQVLYTNSQIRCTILYCLHASMKSIQNALAYFATTVSYTGKIFMKLSSVACTIKVL
jgi:hypothetical protein